MSDLRREGEGPPTAVERSPLDDLLSLALRAPEPTPDVAVAVMAAVAREKAPVKLRRAGFLRRTRPSAAPPLDGPPAWLSLGTFWRPTLAMIGALGAAVLLLLLWSGTPGGQRWLPTLLETARTPVFGWVAGTLFACVAGIAIPMAWMES